MLQVIPEAEPEVIDGAYKRLVTKYHPDNKKTGNADKFRLIHEAHEILTDPPKKKEYDTAYRRRFKRKNNISPATTPSFQKNLEAQDTQSQKKFCNDSFCTGVIDEKGFCTECKKAYIHESQRQTEEQPEIHIIDEDI